MKETRKSMARKRSEVPKDVEDSVLPDGCYRVPQKVVIRNIEQWVNEGKQGNPRETLRKTCHIVYHDLT
jgi:hypothetical protein